VSRAVDNARMSQPDPSVPPAGAFGAAAVSPSDLTLDERLAERLVASEVLYRGRVLEFRVDTVERADGHRARRDVAAHPGAVAIVAVDPEGCVLLVRQYRHPAGRILLEIPAGTLEVDPATGMTEDPEGAARRELEEETGHRAARWERLTDFWTAPGFATERMTLYLATELRPADDDRRGPDEDEALQLARGGCGRAARGDRRREVARRAPLARAPPGGWRRLLASLLPCPAQAVQATPVEAAVRGEGDRQAKMRAALVDPPQPDQRPAQRVVAVVG
jgi:8-oxo-dGTP pyrophosphatase MutT (NUDIX family)